MKRIALFLVMLIMFSACSQKFTFQKRRYQKGFYLASQKNVKNKAQIMVLNQNHVAEAITENNLPVSTEKINPPKPETTLMVEETNKDIAANETNQIKKEFVLPKIFIKNKNTDISPNKITYTQQGNKVNIGLRGGGEVVATILIGYFAVALIGYFIMGILTIGFGPTIMYTLGVILAFIILYAVGKFFKSIFGF